MLTKEYFSVISILTLQGYLACMQVQADEHATPTPKVTLTEVLEVASKTNPDLLAIQAQSEASMRQGDTEFYLPAPTLSVGSMGSQGGLTAPLTSQGHMQTSIQVSQQIPFPTKINKKREALNQESVAIRNSVRAKELALKSEIKKVFAEYWRAHEMQPLLDERSDVIAAHTRRLKAGSLSTQLMQAHLISAGTDLELIKNELDAVRAQEAVSKAQLNTLMGRDPFALLSPASEIPLSSLPPAPTSSSVDVIAESHPLIQESKSRVHASEAQVDAAKSEYLPDFMLTYRKNNNTKNAADVPNSEVMVGITLPFLYFWQPRALSSAAQARQVQAEALLKAKQSGLKLELLQRYSELASLRSQFLRFKDSILTESDRRLKIAHSIAPTDMESLDEHRNAMERSVELRIKALTLRTDFEKALADYENLMGVK